VLLLAYVVRRVSVEDYGIFLLAQSIAAFLYLLDLGLGNVLVQLFVSTFVARGMAEVSRLASTLFFALLGVGTLGAAVVSLAAMLVPRVIQLPALRMGTATEVVVLAAVTVAFTLPASALDHLCQAFHRYDRINQVQIAIVIARVLLTVAVLSAGKGIVGLAAVQVVLALARLAGFWAVARTGIEGLSLGFHFDLIRVRQAMQASGWAFSDDLARRIGMNSESLILAGLGSFRQVALFGIGGRLPAHIYQFAARGLTVMLPSLARHHSEGDTAQLREAYRNAYRMCFTGLLPLVLFAAICSRPLVEVFAGRAYGGAAPVLVWLLLYAFSQVMELPCDMVLYSHERIRLAARFSVIETLGKIAFSLALVVPFGAVGVAAGIAIWHWCVNLFFYLPEACRVAEIRPWELWRAGLAGSARQGAAFVAGAAALYGCSRYLPAAGVFAACLAVCAVYAGIWLACTALPMWRASARGVAQAAQ
jgi:O-antigen/teichoic acid export membrane protein